MERHTCAPSAIASAPVSQSRTRMQLLAWELEAAGARMAGAEAAEKEYIYPSFITRDRSMYILGHSQGSPQNGMDT